VLVDYWFGEVGDQPAPADVEEHLLACDACSGRLRALAALGAAVRQIARQGGLEMIVTRSFLDWAAQEGLRIREYRLESGERAACTATPEDDLLVGRLQCRLTGLSRVDLVWEVEGKPERRLHDVPFDADSGELIIVPAMAQMRTMGQGTWRARLVAPQADGDRVLGEYTFAHTPTRREQ
jgi:hypothetical protein